MIVVGSPSMLQPQQVTGIVILANEGGKGVSESESRFGVNRQKADERGK
jgi:hypothetical protein